jgi:hypothetical protein
MTSTFTGAEDTDRATEIYGPAPVFEDDTT